MRVSPVFVLICKLILCQANKNRIVGGNLAAAGSYPFSAAIYKTTADGQYFCGGSLYTRRWIITAGQCVDGATLFTIYLGTTNIKTPSSTAVKLATEEYVLHPEFNRTALENDIGMIKLRMEISYTENIGPVTLGASIVGDNFVELVALGWGQTSDEEGLSDDLFWVELASISNQQCKMFYGNQITDNMVCVVGNYNEGACHGDTGGPLLSIYHSVPYGPIIIGIASFVSANGCETTDPSGYTRIFPYLDWIITVSHS